MDELRRQRLTPAPDPVPSAPLRGESFVLADGRTFIIPPPTLAQVHGPCAQAFAVVINIVKQDQWGIAAAVTDLVFCTTTLVHEAMSRNYIIERACPAAQGHMDNGVASLLCGVCVACLLDKDVAKTVLVYLTEVCGYRELLVAIGHEQSQFDRQDKSGTKPTIN